MTMTDSSVHEIIKTAISNDDCPPETFMVLDQDVTKASPYRGVMDEISLISRTMGWVADYDQYPTRKFEYPFAYQSTSLKPGLVVLDAGCSIDPFAPYLGSKGLDVHGVDMFYSHDVPWDPEVGIFVGRLRGMEKVKAFSKTLKERLGLSVRYEQSDMSSTKFEAGYFDRVFCISVLEHLPKFKVGIVFDEWRRILKPDGRIVITLDYIVGGVQNFNIGRILDASGFTLDGKITLHWNSRVPDGGSGETTIVVAGFVAAPRPRKPSLFSQIYRRNAIFRRCFDYAHAYPSRVRRRLVRLFSSR